MSLDADAYRELFTAEARELLETLEEGLTKIQEDGPSKEQAAALFRAAHSLKGMAATLGHDEEASLAHAMEDHLQNLQEGKTVPMEDLLEAVGLLQDAVEAIARGGRHDGLGPMIRRLQKEHARRDYEGGQGAAGSSSSTQDSDHEAPQQTGPSTDAGNTEQPETPGGSKGPEGKQAASPSRTHVPPSVRVDAQSLDAILDRVASLRVAQGRLENLLKDSLEGSPGYLLSDALGHLERETHSLYADALQLRTLPASIVTRPLTLRARQTASRHGKQIRLHVDGDTMHLDRSLLEALGDPLVHLLTNAVVHGIESPDERRKNGKKPEGSVHVALDRLQGMLHVRVQDDGAGIDLEAVRRRAVEQGLIEESEATNLDEDNLLGFITRSGFTTSSRLSEEAGRGVGLDAVADNVHRVGGRMEIETTQGEGTMITLVLPPTLSLLEVVPVTINGQRYAIAADHVEQVLTLDDDDIKNGHTRVGDEHTGAHRVQVHRLDELLGIKDTQPRYPPEEGDQAPVIQQAKKIKQAAATTPRPTSTPTNTLTATVQTPLAHGKNGNGHRPTAPSQAGARLGLYVQTRDKRIALLVDDCGLPEEAIVKPLRLPTGAPRGTRGAIVMRDGRVAVVLDPSRLTTNTPETDP